VSLNLEPEWGKHSLLLDLPTGAVCFTGLSQAQLSSLHSLYPRFVRDQTRSAAGSTACRAVRLARPLQIDPRGLAANGLYSPIRVHGPGGIELTGVNFRAQISQGMHGRACLGVALEHELALPNVIENFLRVLAAQRALTHGGALLHSAGLVYNGRCYLFVGRSGAGKTTLSRKAYHDGAVVLSDDINLLLPHEGGYQAYAVPFTGEFGRVRRQDAAKPTYGVAAIILMEQAGQLVVHRSGAAHAVARLVVCCPFVNNDERETATLLENLGGLVDEVPVIHMENRREDSFRAIMAAVRGALSDA
jgi:hypothetical protein